MQAVGPSIDHVRGSSWLHRINPIVKLAWLIAVTAFAFATYDPAPLLAVSVLAFAGCLAAGVGRAVGRTLLIFGPLAASMLVLQTLAPTTCRAVCQPVASIGPLDLYATGMTHGLSLAARIMVVEVVALGVLFTTHPSDLFAALARLRVPYLLNFMVSMTLQLVPIFQREVTVVLAAQRSRGMRNTGFGSIIPTFVPVFAGAFERVQQLSISLESRGFGSSTPATSYRRLAFGGADGWLALAGLAVGVVGVVAGLTFWDAGRTAAAGALPALVVVTLFVAAAVVFLAVVGAAIRTIVRT
jgi:energy-coupling factor transport system permease protein